MKNTYYLPPSKQLNTLGSRQKKYGNLLLKSTTHFPKYGCLGLSSRTTQKTASESGYSQLQCSALGTTKSVSSAYFARREQEFLRKRLERQIRRSAKQQPFYKRVAYDQKLQDDLFFIAFLVLLFFLLCLHIFDSTPAYPFYLE